MHQFATDSLQVNAKPDLFRHATVRRDYRAMLTFDQKPELAHPQPRKKLFLRFAPSNLAQTNNLLSHVLHSNMFGNFFQRFVHVNPFFFSN